MPRGGPIGQTGVVIREIETVQTFLTDSEIDRLIADYNSGMSMRELSQKYGVHRGTVARHLRRHNVAIRSLGLDEAEQADAVRMFRGGVSVRAISTRMGVGRRAIRTDLVKAGVTEAELLVSKARRRDSLV